MLEMNEIEPAETEWNAPIVIELKKNGLLAFGVYYRKLNAVTKVTHTPYPKWMRVLMCSETC